MSKEKPVVFKPINIKNFPADLWLQFQLAGIKKFGHGGGRKALEQAIRAWIGKNKEMVV